jgi:hypothetical protein
MESSNARQYMSAMSRGMHDDYIDDYICPKYASLKQPPETAA